MKKMIILLLLTLAITAYSRDYEYNERRDITMEIVEKDAISKNGRFNCKTWNQVEDRYNKFHSELERQSRGYEDR